MSDQKPPEKPLSVRDAIGSISQSPFRLSLAAVASVFLAMMLPFVGIRVNVGFAAGSSSLSGTAAAGWVAWLALIVFGLAAASRKVAGLYPYKNLLEIGAIVAAVGMALWAWFLNPAAEQISQANQFMGGFGRPGRAPPEMASQYPHVGMLFLLGAVGLVLFSRYKDRSTH